MFEIIGRHSEPILPRRRSANRAQMLRAVWRLVGDWGCDRRHVKHVAFLSMQLFDQLRPLHRLGSEERFWLVCAALLHDIGRGVQQRGHHKASLRIIMNGELPCDMQTRRIIGCIARYHRKALPSNKHRHFQMLDASEKRTVRILSAVLRVADALDRKHLSRVTTFRCAFRPGQIVGHCAVRNARDEAYGQTLVSRVLAKSDLLQRVFSRKLVVQLQSA